MSTNNSQTLVTFFSLPQNQFQQFTHIEEIKTFEFLASCDKVVEFIGAFGIAFTPVRHDVSGNVRKVRAAYTECKCETLDLLLMNDKSVKTADAFIWLTRGLSFMQAFINALITNNTNDEYIVSTAMRQAYDTTLKQHHGWIAQSLFSSLLVTAAPTRTTLLQSIVVGEHNGPVDITIVIDQARIYLASFTPIVQALKQFADKYQLKTL